MSAEIPTKDHMYLRNLVLNYMMHGPYGPNFLTCGCMEQKDQQKICRFNNPKAFTECMTTNAKSYPLYRRRNTGEEIHMRGVVLDNC